MFANYLLFGNPNVGIFIKSINDVMDKAKADKLVYIAFIVCYALEA